MNEKPIRIVLLVEDGIASRQYLKLMLKRLNIEFLEEKNGEDADSDLLQVFR